MSTTGSIRPVIDQPARSSWSSRVARLLVGDLVVKGGGTELLAQLELLHLARRGAGQVGRVLFGMKYAVRAMSGQGSGSIVNWSSVGGLNGAPGTAIYSASKAAVVAATRSAAIECGPMNIRVNAICPGFILTEIMGAMGADLPGIAEKAALNRAGQSPEVAEVGAFQASDRASFVTGAVIPVDGGWSARLA